MSVKQWRVYCTTEAAYKTWWLDSALPSPTTCPTDTAHAIDDDKTALVATIGADDVSVVMTTGGMKVIADGTAFTLEPSKWARADLTLPEKVHLQEVLIYWASCQVGDHGWLSLYHPSSEASPDAPIVQGDATFTMTGRGALYDPLNGARHVEFWNSVGDLIEVKMVASVAGDVVTLAAGTEFAHAADAVVISCYGHHTTMRGTGNIEGGMCFIGSGRTVVGSENSMTAEIPAGLTLGGRFHSSAALGTREFAVNFKMRRPL